MLETPLGSAHRARKVLAVASNGGHWQQMSRIAPAFEELDVLFVTTVPSPDAKFVPDCNQRTPLRALLCLFRICAIMLRFRPDVVVSTGAMPGFLAIAVGRLTGARTLWIDSVANAEQLSLSGRCVRLFAQVRLTQWPDVAAKTGSTYWGSVL